jgi:hypothetical protein
MRFPDNQRGTEVADNNMAFDESQSGNPEDHTANNLAAVAVKMVVQLP